MIKDRGNKADTQKGEEMRAREVKTESLPEVQVHSHQWVTLVDPVSFFCLSGLRFVSFTSHREGPN